MRFETRSVMLFHNDLSWCQDVTVELSAHRVTSRWGCSTDCVDRLLSSGRFDAVLLDVDTLGADASVEIVAHLTTALPAPAIIAWGTAIERDDAFELGRLGVRALLPSRPRAKEVMRVIVDALRTVPTFEPQVRGLVGHMSLTGAIGVVRRLMTDQALALRGGNRKRAAALLQVSRQAVQQALKKRVGRAPERALVGRKIGEDQDSAPARAPKRAPDTRVARAG